MDTPPVIAEEKKMFIIVMYGDDREQVVNPNCRVLSLLKHIKETCQCTTDDTLELSDEHGQVKNLRKNLFAYGAEYFTDRERVILLRVKGGTEDRPSFIPLLEKAKEDQEFLAKLNSRTVAAHSAHSAKHKRFSVVDDGRSSRSNMSRKTSVAAHKKPAMQRRMSKAGNLGLTKK